MLNNVQIFDLIMNSDIFTKIILGILFFLSLISWSIIFDKFIKFRFINIRHNQFQKIFWSGQLLEDVYKKTKNGHKYPMASLFNTAMQEWESNNVIELSRSNDYNKLNSLKERIYDFMSISLSKSILRIRLGFNFLLITATSATLFGLLGTVWGLLTSFQAVSILQTSTLATIAPGMTNALITTICGLATAIPALVAYYVYNNKLAILEIEMENFELEILNILTRELEQ